MMGNIGGADARGAIGLRSDEARQRKGLADIISEDKEKMGDDEWREGHRGLSMDHNGDRAQYRGRPLSARDARLDMD